MFKKRVKKARRYLIDFFALIFTILFCLHHFNYIEYAPDQIAICVFFIVVLSERMEFNSEEFSSRVTDLEKVTESVRNTSATRLLNLTECVKDLAGRIRESHIDYTQTLRVDHLGLNMSNAWDYIYSSLRTEPHFKQTEYRLLMISSDETRFKERNNDLDEWIKTVPFYRKKVISGLSALKSQFSREGKNLLAEVRDYSKIPAIHGVHISSPIDVYYIAICRWDGTNFSDYMWGENNYYRISGHEIENSIHSDLVYVFRSYFEHLWDPARSSSPVVI